MDKKLVSGVLITLVVAGGTGFYSGIKYQQKKSPTNSNFFRQAQSGAFGAPGGTMMRRGNGQNMGFVNGSVLSKDDKSITIKLGESGSKIVFYSSSTSIGKTATGTPEDLQVGEQVMVTGTNNSDGSISAQNIQVRSGLVPLPLNSDNK